MGKVASATTEIFPANEDPGRTNSIVPPTSATNHTTNPIIMINQPKQQLIVWWVLWAAFLAGVFVMYFAMGSGLGTSVLAASSTLWPAAAVPVVISIVIRWLVLPRAQNALSALQIFVVGIVLAEVTFFLGMFIFPAQKLALFILSALGIFQFIPFFARRYYEHLE
jgi:hypothetical protein